MDTEIDSRYGKWFNLPDVFMTRRYQEEYTARLSERERRRWERERRGREMSKMEVDREFR